jgi:arginine N-succinyltransferase
MFVMRDAAAADVDEILEVARHLNSVNLPADRAFLEHSAALSIQSFSGELPPEEREYMFVLEDRSTGRIIGTSIIHAQHGTRRSPHVFLQVVKEERYSETLDRYMVHQGLQIGYNYDGPTEIGGLILLPQYRGNPASLGKLLSYTRFLFISMHRKVFRDQVISELLPPLEVDGTSRLWEHMGRRFTGLGYREADRLSKNNKEFIRALFPHAIVYTALFPQQVQDVIGQVGPETKGVEKMLRRIGFEYADQIDPFDGGPHFKARTDDITLVKESRRVRFTASEVEVDQGRWTIAAYEPGPAQFRALALRTTASGDELTLPAAALAELGADGGSEGWAVTP